MATKTISKIPKRKVKKPKELAPKESTVRAGSRKGKQTKAENEPASTTVKHAKRSKKAIKDTREEVNPSAASPLERDIIIVDRPVRLTGEAEMAKRDDVKVNKARPEGRVGPGEGRR